MLQTCMKYKFWVIVWSRKYFVDGKEVLKTRSFAGRGSRKFTVGSGSSKHEVEIKFDFFLA